MILRSFFRGRKEMDPATDYEDLHRTARLDAAGYLDRYVGWHVGSDLRFKGLRLHLPDLEGRALPRSVRALICLDSD